MSLSSCPEPAAIQKLQPALFRSEHRGKPNPDNEFLTQNTKKHTPPTPEYSESKLSEFDVKPMQTNVVTQ
jgi:hypothetical protein